MALNALNWVDRLRPYRRRVRILLMWRYGAMAGVAGALVATLLSLLDWRGVLTIYPWQLGACIVAGVLMGILYGLLLRVSDAAIAQLIDRRAGLKDRLQTAMEHTDGTHLFDLPLLEDAQNALQSADPKRILRLRFGRWQKLFVGAVALTLFVQFLPQILAITIPERREEQKEIKQAAEEIQEVAKPILEEAKKPDADELTKRIAQNVELYNKRAREAKMSKQEACCAITRFSKRRVNWNSRPNGSWSKPPKKPRPQANNCRNWRSSLINRSNSRRNCNNNSRVSTSNCSSRCRACSSNCSRAKTCKDAP
jgi:hypothetical protein